MTNAQQSWPSVTKPRRTAPSPRTPCQAARARMCGSASRRGGLSLVLVLELQELLIGVGEPMMALGVDDHVVEVVGVSGLQRRGDGGQPRAADGTRWKPLMQIGVVWAPHVVVGLGQGIPAAEGVLDGRVDLERHAFLQPVVDDRGDLGPVLLELGLA